MNFHINALARLYDNLCFWGFVHMTCFEQLLSLLTVFGTPKITRFKVPPGTADSPDNQWLNTARPPVVVSVGRGCHRPTLRRFALHQPDIPLHLHVQSNLSVKYRLRSQRWAYKHFRSQSDNKLLYVIVARHTSKVNRRYFNFTCECYK